MKVTGGDLFFEVFGIIAFFAVIIALIIYLWYLFTEIIPEFRNDYKRFKDSVYQKLHVLDSRVRDLEDGVKPDKKGRPIE